MKKNLHMQTNSKFYKLSLLTALAIGDGSINSRGTLEVRHSIKQLEYTKWKAKLLSKAFNRDINVYSVVSEKYKYCGFSITNKITKRLREILYPNNKKVLSEAILNLLKTPNALTIWYMDDGSLTLHKYKGEVSSREVYWATHSFSRDEVYLVKSWFKRNFNIEVKPCIEKQKYYRLRINASNSLKLFSLFSSIPKSMSYKVNMKYKAQ